MTRVAVRAYEPIEVELWDGAVFETTAVTRSVRKKAQEFFRAYLEADDPDEEITALSKLFDLKLSPIGESRAKPSTLILKRWKADGLSVPELEDLIERIAEAEKERPT